MTVYHWNTRAKYKLSYVKSMDLLKSSILNSSSSSSRIIKIITLTIEKNNDEKNSQECKILKTKTYLPQIWKFWEAF